MVLVVVDVTVAPVVAVAGGIVVARHGLCGRHAGRSQALPLKFGLSLINKFDKDR
jgi:hypothetical protein